MFYEMTGFAPVPHGAEEGIPDRPDLGHAALFLDFDGTLVEIADRPDLIIVPDDLAALLTRTFRACDGAVAIVSGRAASSIADYLAGFDGDLIASHGAERRIGGRHQSHPVAGSAQVARLQGVVRSFASLDEGFLAENKPCGVTLHFRGNPDLYSEAHRFAESLIGHFPEFKIQPAKLAVEIKPADVGKADAVRWLMERPPYHGRMPVYIGDDATDEAAMEFAVSSGGIAVKVGDGETRANHRLASAADVRAILADWTRDGR